MVMDTDMADSPEIALSSHKDISTGKESGLLDCKGSFSVYDVWEK